MSKLRDWTFEATAWLLAVVIFAMAAWGVRLLCIAFEQCQQ